MAGGNILVQGNSLQELVTEASFSVSSFSTIHKHTATCLELQPHLFVKWGQRKQDFFLSGSWCTIQASQGEEILPDKHPAMAAAFLPRPPGAVIAKLTAGVRTCTWKDSKILCKISRWWGSGQLGLQTRAAGQRLVLMLLGPWYQEKGMLEDEFYYLFLLKAS